ncbi:MAG: lipopolysaccharide biosynthesis protein [Candidatus Lokiarchaeota archaeon]|nr:lipopolysaccharide biosynthesis protein [Candidatus Lokiarchaeota archaeon]
MNLVNLGNLLILKLNFIHLKIFQESLFRNSLHLILSTFVTSGIGFFFWIIASRLSTATEIGIASTLISSMNLIAILALFGFNISIIRFLPSFPEKNELLNTAFYITLFGTVILSLIFIIGLPLWASKLSILYQNWIFPLLFVFFTELWVITSLLSSIFIAQRTAKLVLFKETVFGLSKIFLLVPLLAVGAMGIFMAWGFGSLIAVGIGIVFFLKFFPGFRLHTAIDWNILRKVSPYSFSNYLSWVFAYLPSLALPIIISGILDPQTTAFFYMAWMIANLLFTIPMQTSQALFAEGSNDEAILGKNVRQALKFIFPLLIIGIGFLIIFGREILTIFGSDYSIEGYLLLQILSISSLPYAVNAIFLSIEKVRKNNRAIILITLVVALITLSGSVILLKNFGLLGVGLAWLVGNSLVAMGIMSVHRQFIQ